MLQNISYKEKDLFEKFENLNLKKETSKIEKN